MKVNISPMNYSSLLHKLKVGVSLADRDRSVKEVSKFNSENERQLMAAVIRTGQMDQQHLGLGYFGQTDLMTQIQAGDFLPNEFLGWSTKTILAGLALLLLLKLKKVQK